LNAANGVGRVFWYVWDLSQPIVDTYMVEPDGATPTAAGRAFRTVHRWMIGAEMHGCPVGKDGTYACTLLKDGKKRLVLWNPTHSVQIQPPQGVTTAEKLIGAKETVTPSTTLTIDQMPVLLQTQ
jgi:hypothetical protein